MKSAMVTTIDIGVSSWFMHKLIGRPDGTYAPTNERPELALASLSKRMGAQCPIPSPWTVARCEGLTVWSLAWQPFASAPEVRVGGEAVVSRAFGLLIRIDGELKMPGAVADPGKSFQRLHDVMNVVAGGGAEAPRPCRCWFVTCSAVPAPHEAFAIAAEAIPTPVGSSRAFSVSAGILITAERSAEAILISTPAQEENATAARNGALASMFSVFEKLDILEKRLEDVSVRARAAHKTLAADCSATYDQAVDFDAVAHRLGDHVVRLSTMLEDLTSSLVTLRVAARNFEMAAQDLGVNPQQSEAFRRWAGIRIDPLREQLAVEAAYCRGWIRAVGAHHKRVNVLRSNLRALAMSKMVNAINDSTSAITAAQHKLEIVEVFVVAVYAGEMTHLTGEAFEFKRLYVGVWLMIMIAASLAFGYSILGPSSSSPQAHGPWALASRLLLVYAALFAIYVVLGFRLGSGEH